MTGSEYVEIDVTYHAGTGMAVCLSPSDDEGDSRWVPLSLIGEMEPRLCYVCPGESARVEIAQWKAIKLGWV